MPENLVSYPIRRDVIAFPSASGVLSRLAAERVIQAGIDVRPLLKKADLPEDILNDPHVRVKVRGQIDFIELAAEALEDNLFGFRLAKDTDLREAGPIYYLMASSETLGEAFEYAARYNPIINEGIQIQRGPNAFTLAFEYIDVKRILDHHQIEFWMTASLRLSRLFTGRELIPTYVGFIHRHEGDVSEMERYFGCNLDFGAAKDQISLEAHESRLPLVHSDPYLNRFLIGYFEEAVAGHSVRQQSIRTRVENAIVPRLPQGTMSIGNIANDLNMSVRTLSRRLAQEGATFSTILEELRSNLASRYLQDNDLTISQIAWLLGYSEVSSFAHAFQRWTGNSPTYARRQISDAALIKEA
jgi:AraC-like DNA-binding protein